MGLPGDALCPRLPPGGVLRSLGDREVEGFARLVTDDPSIMASGGLESLARPDYYLDATAVPDDERARQDIARVAFRPPSVQWSRVL